MLAAHAIATIFYLIRKEAGIPKAKGTIAALLRFLAVARVDDTVIQEALRLPCVDFEDAVAAAAARASGCHYVIARDPKGFRGSPVQVLTPEAALPLFSER